jgi:hypothetical protein
VASRARSFPTYDNALALPGAHARVVPAEFGDGNGHLNVRHYLGIFDDVALALQFDEKGVRKAVSNIAELVGKLPGAMQKCLACFAGCDRTLQGYEGLIAAQECLPTNDTRDAFAADFSVLAWQHNAELFYPGSSGLSTRVVGDTGGFEGTGWYDWIPDTSVPSYLATPGDSALVDDAGARMVRWSGGNSGYRGLLGPAIPATSSWRAATAAPPCTFKSPRDPASRYS